MFRRSKRSTMARRIGARWIGIGALGFALSGCNMQALQQVLTTDFRKPLPTLSMSDMAQIRGESNWDYFSRLQATLLRLDIDKRGRALNYTDPSLGLLVEKALDSNLVVTSIAQTKTADIASTQRLIEAFNAFTPVYERYQQAERWYPREFTHESLDAMYIQALLSRALSDDLLLLQRLRSRPQSSASRRAYSLEIPAGVEETVVLTSPAILSQGLKKKLDEAYFSDAMRQKAIAIHHQLSLLARQ